MPNETDNVGLALEEPQLRDLILLRRALARQGDGSVAGIFWDQARAPRSYADEIAEDGATYDYATSPAYRDRMYFQSPEFRATIPRVINPVVAGEAVRQAAAEGPKAPSGPFMSAPAAYQTEPFMPEQGVPDHTAITKPIGQAFGRSGRALVAGVGDLAGWAHHVATGPEGVPYDWENLWAFGLDPDAPTPIERYVEDADGWQRGLGKTALTVIHSQPRIAASLALGGAGMPSFLAAGLPALVTDEGEIDLAGAVIGGFLPGVSRLGEAQMARLLSKIPMSQVVVQLSQNARPLWGKVVQRLGGVEISSDLFRKFLEKGGGILAMNAFLLALKSPDIIYAPEGRRQQAALDFVAENLAPTLLSFAEVNSGKPSSTLKLLEPKIRAEFEAAGLSKSSPEPNGRASRGPAALPEGVSPTDSASLARTAANAPTATEPIPLASAPGQSQASSAPGLGTLLFGPPKVGPVLGSDALHRATRMLLDIPSAPSHSVPSALPEAASTPVTSDPSKLSNESFRPVVTTGDGTLVLPNSPLPPGNAVAPSQTLPPPAQTSPQPPLPSQVPELKPQPPAPESSPLAALFLKDLQPRSFMDQLAAQLKLAPPSQPATTAQAELKAALTAAAQPEMLSQIAPQELMVSQVELPPPPRSAGQPAPAKASEVSEAYTNRVNELTRKELGPGLTLRETAEKALLETRLAAQQPIEFTRGYPSGQVDGQLPTGAGPSVLPPATLGARSPLVAAVLGKSIAPASSFIDQAVQALTKYQPRTGAFGPPSDGGRSGGDVQLSAPTSSVPPNGPNLPGGQGVLGGKMESTNSGAAPVLLDDLVAKYREASRNERKKLIREARSRLSVAKIHRGKIQLSVRSENAGVQRAAQFGAKILEIYVDPELLKDLAITVEDSADTREYHNNGTVFLLPRTKGLRAAHEIIHRMEERHPQLVKDAAAFLLRRAKGSKAKRLSELTGIEQYRDWELAYEDDWVERGGDAYMGKKYSAAENPSQPEEFLRTEILTMGFERLIANPIELYLKDQEVYEVVVRLLRNL